MQGLGLETGGVIGALRKFIASHAEFDDRGVQLGAEEVEELRGLVEQC